MTECKQVTLHAERFKEHLLMIIKLFCREMETLQQAKKPVPVKPMTINMFVSAGLQPKAANELIDGFISRTQNEWSKIKSRDKAVILEVIPTMLRGDVPADTELTMADKLVKSYADTIVGYLKNRRAAEDDIFEEEVWSCLDKMISHCILYIHHKRVPNPEKSGHYLQKYQKEFKLKKTAEEWEIKLLWPSSKGKDSEVEDMKHVDSEAKPEAEPLAEPEAKPEAEPTVESV